MIRTAWPSRALPRQLSTEAVVSRWQRLREERRRAPAPTRRAPPPEVPGPQRAGDALKLVRQGAWARFDESVELVFRLGVDPRRAEQNVRGVAALPHGSGKVVKVAVFADGGKGDEATAAGGDLVGGDELVDEVVRTKGKALRGFGACLAVPEMMGGLAGRIGRILGPSGLMPTLKTGTVTADLAAAIKRLKKGQMAWRTDRAGNVHTRVGKLSFSDDQLAENIFAVAGSVIRARPATVKKRYLKKAVLCSSMGPAITLDVAALTADAEAASEAAAQAEAAEVEAAQAGSLS